MKVRMTKIMKGLKARLYRILKGVRCNSKIWQSKELYFKRKIGRFVEKWVCGSAKTQWPPQGLCTLFRQNIREKTNIADRERMNMIQRVCKKSEKTWMLFKSSITTLGCSKVYLSIEKVNSNFKCPRQVLMCTVNLVILVQISISTILYHVNVY